MSRACARLFAVCVLGAVAVAGCEAPLDLDAVERSRQATIRRSDVFQAAVAAGSVVVVVGSGGLILRSADRGRTWRRTELEGLPYLIDAGACGADLFAALSYEGDVWVSRDQGATWSRKSLQTEEQPQAIHCDPKGKLWVVGSLSTIWNSADRGETWNSSSLGEDVILTEVQFLDGDLGYISGEFGTVLKTENGGGNWERLPPLPEEFYPQDMRFLDREQGWVAGLAGVILRTSDGGQNWRPEPTGTLAALYGLETFSGTLFAVGAEGTILRLDGTRWHVVDHGQPIRFYLRGMRALDGQSLLVLGPSGTLKIFPAGVLLQEGRQSTGARDRG
ncbi:MAG: hypothetical protein HYR49_09860 [Gammaproteobacteria bacterium]|nr:hypothetical protein [Gammaproteobacteria bacterium]